MAGVGLLLSGTVWAVDPAAKARFTLVFDGTGVKDSRTGLVWEQAPDSEFDGWSASIARCRTKTVGGQQGWRAPSLDELTSLVDRDQQDPALPHGHPFSNIKSSIFWTATPSSTDDIVAWQVSFFSGSSATDQKSGMRRIWCVLGEMSK